MKKNELSRLTEARPERVYSSRQDFTWMGLDECPVFLLTQFSGTVVVWEV